MKVVSVINYKGGVGKTTLTANLGAYLARLGKRVLLVDLDPQSSLTLAFFTLAPGSSPFPANRTLRGWPPPDYLSTLGTANLLTALERFVETFNHQVDDYSPRSGRISPTPLGVVFTMVQYRGAQPIADHKYFMDYTRRVVGEVPVFAATLRENAAFNKENPRGVPVILKLKPTDKVYLEMMELANAFIDQLDDGKKRAVA